jgi:hypothetical protein
VSEKRGWGKTVLGWFVTSEGANTDAASDQAALIDKYASQPVPTHPVEWQGPLPQSIGSPADFAAVYEAAGVGAEEHDRVVKAQELLRSLPGDTPAPVKKQIVEASLKAFGVPTAKIIEAAVEQVQALEGFIRSGQADTQKVLGEGNQRIAQLEAEIAQCKQVMQQAVAEQEARARAANAEKLNIQQVLEFFGQDAVARVVEESPKLHKPE